MLAREMNVIANKVIQDEFDKKKQENALVIAAIEENVRTNAAKGWFLYRRSISNPDLTNFLREYFTIQGFTVTSTLESKNGELSYNLELDWKNKIFR